MMKWWAQSFLVGVPKIVCGFRDDDGLVKSIQNFRTSTIPHDSQVRLPVPLCIAQGLPVVVARWDCIWR